MRFPWSVEEAQARDFRVQERDGLTLITPSREKSKWKFDPNDPYANDSELVWRSALLNEDMEAVSLGFPKFFNYGEFGADAIDRKIERAISDGSALLTAKEDGTLIIRSVYQGQVIWRTRNSFDLGPFHDPVMELVNRDPLLTRADCNDDVHMLFEYVSPSNQIVIRYDVPNLILLGCRDCHQILHSCYWPSGPRVRLIRMSARDPWGLQKEITELELDGLWDCEGLVVRTPDGLMSKIKGSQYLNAFRMKYLFKYSDFAALCLSNQCQSLDQAKDVCVTNGVDWEALYCAEQWWDVYWARMTDVQADVVWAENFLCNWINTYGVPNRKAYAQRLNGVGPRRQAFAFVLLDNNPSKWEKTYQKARDKHIFAPVADEYRSTMFSLQEEA